MKTLAISAVSALLAVLAPGNALADAASSAAQNAFGAGKQYQDGQQIYQHVCQGCHMPDARGALGAAAIPALARNPKLETAGYPISVVLNGFGDMPWFNGALTDGQIAAVINYVRSHFGNDYKDIVTPADVAALKGPAPTMER